MCKQSLGFVTYALMQLKEWKPPHGDEGKRFMSFNNRFHRPLHVVPVSPDVRRVHVATCERRRKPRKGDGVMGKEMIGKR